MIKNINMSNKKTSLNIFIFVSVPIIDETLALWVERSLRVWKVGGSNPLSGQVKHLKMTPAASIIKGLEQVWLAQCQFKVTRWGIMFICGMVLRLETRPVKADLTTTTVVHSSKLMINTLMSYSGHYTKSKQNRK